MRKKPEPIAVPEVPGTKDEIDIPVAIKNCILMLANHGRALRQLQPSAINELIDRVNACNENYKGQVEINLQVSAWCKTQKKRIDALERQVAIPPTSIIETLKRIEWQIVKLRTAIDAALIDRG